VMPAFLLLAQINLGTISISLSANPNFFDGTVPA